MYLYVKVFDTQYLIVLSESLVFVYCLNDFVQVHVTIKVGCVPARFPSSSSAHAY